MSTHGDTTDEGVRGQPEEALLSPEPEIIAPKSSCPEDVTQLYLTEIGAKPLRPQEGWRPRLVRQGDFAARQSA